MLKEIEQLLVLQDRDRKIRALKNELKHLPGERKDLDARLAASNHQLDAEKLKGKSIEVEKKNLEIEVASKQATIAKYNLQKFETRKNDEFQAITNEIKRLEGDVSALEDRELELMEAADLQKVVVAEADKAAVATRALVTRNLQSLEEKTAAIHVQLKELEAERAKLSGQVEEDLLDTYTRLFSSKSDNAVVGLEHDVCTGCHMKLTASTSAKVRAAREIAHCEQCGRILYWVS